MKYVLPAESIARWATRKPILLVLLAIVLGATAIFVIFQKRSFDSEILNLLPEQSGAVRGLKIYNQEFTQARELTFVIEARDDAENVEAFSEFFVQQLRQEPWVARVFDRFPLESKEEREALPVFMLPMLMNLDDGRFAKALKLLQPEQLRSRIHHLRLQAEAGSPKAQMELENDPLGILTLAASPLTEDTSLGNTFSLTTPDGLLRMVPVITTQKNLDAPTCREVMDKVHALIEKTRKQWNGTAPTVLVTGRSAYVSEISSSMQRDFIVTSAVSMAVVVGFFYLGFRRFVPLMGIILLLTLSSVVALALGMLLIHQLNVIAMAFCSILFGLGDDFSLLLYASFQKAMREGKERGAAIAAAVREVSPGIFSVSLTTGIGFLALCFSGSPGFGQLGILIAIGINICAILMVVFLPMFFLDRPHASHPAPDGRGFAAAIRFTLKNCRLYGMAGIILFGALGTIAVIPWRTLQFDVSPHSLEPKSTPASIALQRILEKFPDSMEPLLIILDSKNAEATSEDNRKLVKVLHHLKEQGIVTSWAGPSALSLSQKQMEKNREKLKAIDLVATKDALAQTENEEGFRKGALDNTRGLLSALAQDKKFSWRELPQTSSWWFLIDRFLSPDSARTATFVRIPDGISYDIVEKAVLESSGEIPLLLSGWSLTLHSLIPWAKRELLIFGGLVSSIALLILALIYRNGRLWTIHALSLVLALGATVATLKFFGLKVNLLNVLAFPLMLAVGVDYGAHILMACRHGGNAVDNLASVVKPVVLSAITTIAGFGSLMLAQNPSLRDFGTVCAIGVFWYLCGAIFFVLPMAEWCYLRRKLRP